jgi:sugar/nucleoside kinase (ribokinase family)
MEDTLGAWDYFLSGFAYNYLKTQHIKTAINYAINDVYTFLQSKII